MKSYLYGIGFLIANDGVGGTLCRHVIFAMDIAVNDSIEGCSLVGCFTLKRYTVDSIQKVLLQALFDFFRRAFILSGFIINVPEVFHFFISSQILVEFVK